MTRGEAKSRGANSCGDTSRLGKGTKGSWRFRGGGVVRRIQEVGVVIARKSLGVQPPYLGTSYSTTSSFF